MLKYIIIQLSDSSTSFCHYLDSPNSKRLISVDNLNAGLIYSMKENLFPQFLMPKDQMPPEYESVISRVNSIIIAPNGSYYAERAHVVVHHSVSEFNDYTYGKEQIHHILITPDQISSLYDISEEHLFNTMRLNIAIQGIEYMNENAIKEYGNALKSVADKLEAIYRRKGTTHLNLLSDILFTNTMNNCNAGVESITLAPNGEFYLCPAFYLDDTKNSIGTLNASINIKNQHLLKLKFSPICRICDAYHCRRCIWLNQKLTGELNTPSHQQCVLSHLERNQSRKLLSNIREVDSSFVKEKEIKQIDYLDPFDLITR